MMTGHAHTHLCANFPGTACDGNACFCKLGKSPVPLFDYFGHSKLGYLVRKRDTFYILR